MPTKQVKALERTEVESVATGDSTEAEECVNTD